MPDPRLVYHYQYYRERQRRLPHRTPEESGTPYGEHALSAFEAAKLTMSFIDNMKRHEAERKKEAGS